MLEDGARGRGRREGKGRGKRRTAGGGGRTKGMRGCERGACADETRSGTCGPHRSEPVFANHTLRRSLTCPPGCRSQPFPPTSPAPAVPPASVPRRDCCPWKRASIRRIVPWIRNRLSTVPRRLARILSDYGEVRLRECISRISQYCTRRGTFCTIHDMVLIAASIEASYQSRCFIK